jgi:hypothetical protein
MTAAARCLRRREVLVQIEKHSAWYMRIVVASSPCARVCQLESAVDDANILVAAELVQFFCGN